MLDVIYWGVLVVILIWCLSGAYDGHHRVWRENFKSKDTMIFDHKDKDEENC